MGRYARKNLKHKDAYAGKAQNLANPISSFQNAQVVQLVSIVIRGRNIFFF